MTSGGPADRDRTDPYASVYGPSGGVMQKAGHGQQPAVQTQFPGLPAADSPDGGRPAEVHRRGKAAPTVPPNWEEQAETLLAHDRVTDAVRLVRAAIEHANERVSRAIALREDAARRRGEADMIREEALVLRKATERERAAIERENDMLARSRTKLMQEHKALDIETRDLQRLRDEILRREAALREAAARKGRRTASEPLPVIDDHGAVLRPDPSTATTPRQFMEALRQYRRWAGNPSYRVMSDRIGGHPVASTIQTMLARDELPTRLEAVDAVIRGCCGTPDDRKKFATAWRLLTL